jgi:hypothetical protein
LAFLASALAILAANPGFSEIALRGPYHLPPPDLELVREEIIECSGYFEARADWEDKLDGNPAFQHMMQSYADFLLASALNLPMWVDRNQVDEYLMVEDAHGMKPLKEQFALDFLTRFAELGDLPLCSGDYQCMVCGTVLRNQGK